jgi:hypothetical protein
MNPLYELDGTPWIYNPQTHLWECQCRHCHDEPQLAEKLTYADLTAEYTVSDWDPAARAA